MRFIYSRLLPRTAAIACVAFAASNSYAQVSYNQRTSDYVITYNNLGFGSATAYYDITTDVSASAKGNTDSETPIAVKTLGTNVKAFGTGGATFGYDQPTLTATTTFSGNNLSGQDHLNYQTPIGTNFNDSFLVGGTANGLHTLEFDGGGYGLLNTGKSFILNVAIQGKWTSMGTGTGDMQLLGYDTQWSAPQISYSGGATHIYMIDKSYNQATDPSPDLDFKLYGKAVPEPASWAVLSMGLIGVGLRRRKKA